MTDFSECEYIENYLKIYSYEDFIKNRKLIKRRFQSMNKNGQRFYQWYLYSNIHMDYRHKNAIWDYINLTIDEAELFKFKEFNKTKKI